MEHNITQLLIAWSQGDKQALDRLIPMLHQQLHQLAAKRLSQERPGHTLQATALVNEVYLQLIKWQPVDWQNRAHFFGVVANIMRNILIDHARKQHAHKRGGDRYRISLTNLANLAAEPELDVIALDDALKVLAVVDLQQSQIVELRYFVGLSIAETAEVLGLSTIAVSREWKLAKLWLLRELDKTAN